MDINIIFIIIVVIFVLNIYIQRKTDRQLENMRQTHVENLREFNKIKGESKPLISNKEEVYIPPRVVDNIVCLKHPNYNGIGAPRLSCKACCQKHIEVIKRQIRGVK